MLSLFQSKPVSSSNVEKKKPDQTAELKSFPLPKKTGKMEDYLADAETSTGPFEYITISSRVKVSKLERLARLYSSAYVPLAQEVEVEDLPPLTLRSRKIVFNIVDYMPKNALKGQYEWLLIEEVKTSFYPAQSHNDDHSTVYCALVDGRKIAEMDVRTVKSMSHVGFTATMHLDHSVHRDDISAMCLKIELLNSPLRADVAWGSLAVTIKLQRSNACMSVPVLETQAVLNMPDTGLKNMSRNPYHVDLSMDPEDLKIAKRFAKTGRIIDQTKPRNRQEKILYSKSEAGSVEQETSEADVGEGPSNKEDKIKKWRKSQEGGSVEAEKIRSRVMTRSPPPSAMKKGKERQIDPPQETEVADDPFVGLEIEATVEEEKEYDPLADDPDDPSNILPLYQENVALLDDKNSKKVRKTVRISPVDYEIDS